MLRFSTAFSFVFLWVLPLGGAIIALLPTITAIASTMTATVTTVAHNQSRLGRVLIVALRRVLVCGNRHPLGWLQRHSSARHH